MRHRLAALALVASTCAAFAQSPANTPAGTSAGTPAGTANQPATMQNTSSATPGARNPGAPEPGRNSFTQAQAMRRIRDAGYTDVSGLKKDNQGIWRGQAKKDGNSTAVSLDFKGDVTAQ